MLASTFFKNVCMLLKEQKYQQVQAELTVQRETKAVKKNYKRCENLNSPLE